MHSRTVVLIMILVALGSLFFLVQPDPPEMVRAVSSDGVFQVEALASRQPILEVAALTGGASTARVSSVYEVSGTATISELGVQVSLASVLDAEDHLLGSWDGNLEAWVVNEGTDYSNGTFSSRGNVSSNAPGSRWALFQKQDVEIPHRYEQIVAGLIENRPAKTNRAHINLSYAFEPDDYVLMRSARVTAACGGDLRAPRGSKEVEEVIEPITLSVNENEREGWIRVVANWELEDGCAKEEDFELIQ